MDPRVQLQIGMGVNVYSLRRGFGFNLPGLGDVRREDGREVLVVQWFMQGRKHTKASHYMRIQPELMAGPDLIFGGCIN